MKALRKAGNTLPGPDGIPFAAWRRCADLSADILKEATEYMMEGGVAGIPADVVAEFNQSLMFSYRSKSRAARILAMASTTPRASAH